jgi:hypothetical protein
VAAAALATAANAIVYMIYESCTNILLPLLLSNSRSCCPASV